MDQSQLDSAKHYISAARKIFYKLNIVKNISKTTNSLGAVYYYMGEKDSAIIQFDKSFKFSAENKYSEGIAQSISLLGFMLDEQGDYYKAIDYYKQGIDIYLSIDDTIALQSNYNDMGVAYSNLGKLDSALNYYLIALDLSKKVGIKQLCNYYLNVGTIHNKLGDTDKSKEYFLLAYENGVENNSYRSLVSVLGNLINIHLNKNSVHISEKYQIELDSIVNKLNEKELIARGVLSKARIHEFKLETEDAVKLYKNVIAIYTEINMSSELPAVYNLLAENLIVLNRITEANSALKKSISLSIKHKNLSDKSDAYLLKSQAMDEIGDYKKSLFYYKQYKETSDSILNEGSLKKLTQMEMQYQFDQEIRERELHEAKKVAVHKAEMEKQKFITTSLILGAILLLLVIIFVLRGYLIKKKSNKELQYKNEQIQQQKEEIEAQRDLVHKQNDEITSSINYAGRIQKALLPDNEILDALLPNYFVFFKPRDIVSGDFYWIKPVGSYIVVAAADCTGHGVPGAFMSMLGISFLNEITKSETELTAAEILNRLREKVKITLNQSKEGAQKDGMDMALCVIDTSENKLQFSGAFNPLYLVRNNAIEIIKPDRQPVAVYIQEKDFTNHIIDVEKGDKLYIFSDGFADQIGGEKQRKYMSKRFRELLLANSGLEMEEQKNRLDQEFEKWRKSENQMDDVLVIGIKI